MLLWGQESQEGVGQQTIYSSRSYNHPEQIPLHLLRLQLLEVAGIQIKVTRMILTTLMFFWGGMGEDDSWKILKQKILWHSR